MHELKIRVEFKFKNLNFPLRSSAFNIYVSTRAEFPNNFTYHYYFWQKSESAHQTHTVQRTLSKQIFSRKHINLHWKSERNHISKGKKSPNESLVYPILVLRPSYEFRLTRSRYNESITADVGTIRYIAHVPYHNIAYFVQNIYNKT